MSEKFDKFSNEITELLSEGELLLMALQHEQHPNEFKKAYGEVYEKKKLERIINKLPMFGQKYQSWFSKSQAVVKQILPDRISDFNNYYEYPKARKSITFQNYMIKDCLQDLIIREYGDIKVDGSAAIPEFTQQINILRAAKDALTSRLMEIRSILQADLFDSEVDSAKALAKAGYSRAAGAICGVIIEKHLAQVCNDHSFVLRKKNPTISDLNQLLRDNDTISIPQWRFIQHLADIRNICDHAKGREPAKDEINDLIKGTEKILKTIF